MERGNMRITTKRELREKISGLDRLVAELRRQNELKDKQLFALTAAQAKAEAQLKATEELRMLDAERAERAGNSAESRQAVNQAQTARAASAAEQLFLREEARLAVFGQKILPRNYTDSEIKSMIKRMLEKNRPQTDTV